MISPCRLVLIPLMLVLFTLIGKTAKAQELSFDNLKKIISAVATDTSLKALRGMNMAPQNKTVKKYQASVTLWADGSGGQSEHRDQYIEYDSLQSRYYYYAYLSDDMDEHTGVKVTQTIEAIFSKRLGNEWVLKTEPDEQYNPVYYFKNPLNFVTIKIFTYVGATHIECYNDSKNSAPKCIAGNCDDHVGVKQYFNEDVYSGTFIDGRYNGMGSLKWYNNGARYEGAFIDSLFEGYGSIFNEKNEVSISGIFFKGRLVNVDTTNKKCQFGNCETGFGLKVISGGFYIGGFKEGLFDGIGELLSTNMAFFGYFKKNAINGKGILINKQSEYTFANFKNGLPVGNYEIDLRDGTTQEVNAENGAGGIYDTNNILIRSGIWTKTGFTENPDTGYLFVKKCAGSLSGFYSHQKNDYEEIRGEKLGYSSNKSTLLFLNTFETKIAATRKPAFHFYISVALSGKDNRENVYNKYYNSLNKLFGNRWEKITDSGLASATNIKSSLSFQDIFIRSKTVVLSVDENGVKLEIH